MGQELNRVKHDLDTITAASGLGQPPIGREDVWMFYGVAVLGAAYMAAIWIIGGPARVVNYSTVLVMLALVAVYHFGGKRSGFRQREYKRSLWWGLALGVGKGRIRPPFKQELYHLGPTP